MSLQWIHENPPHWDETKARIIGGAPSGIFELADHGDGDLIPGEWWRVEKDGQTVGYGWMDIVWGDGEMLLCVDSAAADQGIGSFILDRLEEEAASRGLNYLYNVVRPTHPDREGITKWLQARGFADRGDERLERRIRATTG